MVQDDGYSLIVTDPTSTVEVGTTEHRSDQTDPSESLSRESVQRNNKSPIDSRNNSTKAPHGPPSTVQDNNNAALSTGSVENPSTTTMEPIVVTESNDILFQPMIVASNLGVIGVGQNLIMNVGPDGNLHSFPNPPVIISSVAHANILLELANILERITNPNTTVNVSIQLGYNPSSTSN